MVDNIVNAEVHRLAGMRMQNGAPPCLEDTRHLNTPRLVADATGTTVWRWDQAEPFGADPADEDPDGNSVAFDLPLRLPGQRHDAETGLHYNGLRDYSADNGGFSQADPIGIVTYRQAEQRLNH